MEKYIKTKNYVIKRDDIVEMKQFGDKIRIRFYDWLKTDKNEVECSSATKYPTTMFVYKKDIKELEIDI